MHETPQSFASKAAIIEVLKRACGAQLTPREVVDAASRELDVAPSEVASALDALKLEAHVKSVMIDGEERVVFTPVAH